MKSKYKSGNILGCYELIAFDHLIKRNSNKLSYFWKCRCLKCNKTQIKILNKKKMTETQYCKYCLERKYFPSSSECKKKQNIQEYLKSKITINKNNCWIWKGYVGRTGYCDIHFNGKRRTVHTLSYEAFKGKIPKKMYVCHHCDIKNCINPDHLFLG